MPRKRAATPPALARPTRRKAAAQPPAPAAEPAGAEAHPVSEAPAAAEPAQEGATATGRVYSTPELRIGNRRYGPY